MMAREREADLLFVGQQLRDALTRYARESPAGAPKYPKTLDELLLDKRYPTVRRHLRRVYNDPMTGASTWGLIRQQDRIVGVYSLASGAPLKRSGFPPEMIQLTEAKSYRDWRFVAEGANLAAVDAAGRPKPQPDQPPANRPAPAPAPVQEAASLPNPPPPCLAEQTRAVDLCWSDRASPEQNRACEDASMNVYNTCMQARLYGTR